jgi:nitrite reductase/ring-hydroxylating ferredoxin subunit
VGEHLVARVDDLDAERGLLVDVQGRRVGVFKLGDEVFALQAVCPHQGGPIGAGGVFPRACGEVVDGRLREWNDHENAVVACPWHGWEFDIRTGACVGDPERKLRRYVTEVREGSVYVTT